MAKYLITTLKISCLASVLLFTSACSYIPWFGGEDEISVALRIPAELTEIPQSFQLQREWAVSGSSDAANKYIRLRPLLFGNQLAFVDTEANITVYDNANGSSVWSRKLRGQVTGGVGGDAEILVVGNSDGRLMAVKGSDGEDLWVVDLTSEVRAVSERVIDIVVVRTGDNRVHGVDIKNGETVWVVQQSPPALTLRGVSTPLIRDGIAYAGLDNGKVVAIDVASGNVIWESRVSIPSGRTELERIVDVDGQLAADETFIYAASYHGRVVAIDRANGRISWARDIPSVSGVSADDEVVYFIDRDDSVWALEKRSGITVWKQDSLIYRELSAPVVFDEGVLVGDFEGYLHFLSKQDGKLIGRTRFGKSAVHTSTLDTFTISYVSDAAGQLAAYSVSPLN